MGKVPDCQPTQRRGDLLTCSWEPGGESGHSSYREEPEWRGLPESTEGRLRVTSPGESRDAGLASDSQTEFQAQPLHSPVL